MGMGLKNQGALGIDFPEHRFDFGERLVRIQSAQQRIRVIDGSPAEIGLCQSLQIVFGFREADGSKRQTERKKNNKQISHHFCSPDLALSRAFLRG